MPTYEYVCDHCGHEYEMFQSMKDDPVKTCPECGEEKARRLLGRGAGIIFKGSGFYETDYRSESYKKAAKAEQEAASGGKDKKSDGKAKSSPASSETSTKAGGDSSKGETT